MKLTRETLEQIKRLKDYANNTSWQWTDDRVDLGNLYVPRGSRLGNTGIVTDRDCRGEDAAACLLISIILKNLDHIIPVIEGCMNLDDAAMEFIALAQQLEHELVMSDIETKPIECTRRRMEKVLGIGP